MNRLEICLIFLFGRCNIAIRIYFVCRSHHDYSYCVDFTLASVVIGELESSNGMAGEKEYGFSADVPTSYP